AVPDVMHASVDQLSQPVRSEQFIDVGLANAGGNTGQNFFAQAMVQPAQRFVEDIFFAASLIAGDLAAFDADEWSDIPKLAQPPGSLLGDELAIGEKL